jgi:hypothetical protein
MKRQPTPNILDELLPTKSETTELRNGLKWDYSQLGDAAPAQALAPAPAQVEDVFA